MVTTARGATVELRIPGVDRPTFGRFKGEAIARGVSMVEAIEEAMHDWTDRKDAPVTGDEPNPSVPAGRLASSIGADG